MTRKRKNKQRQGRSRTTRKIDKQKILEIIEWLGRMQQHANKAIDLSREISVADMHESSDRFWALAKYAENVQESAVQLDNINKTVFPSLIEISMASKQEDSDVLSWKGLKNMRAKLTHTFWSIDPHVLWETVTIDFPTLVRLFSTLKIMTEPVDLSKETFAVPVNVKEFISLPIAYVEEKIEAGKMLILLFFDINGKAETFRVGHTNSNNKVLVSCTAGNRLSIKSAYGIKYNKGNS